MALQKDLAEGKKIMSAETRRLTEEEIRRGQNMRDLRRQQEDYAKTPAGRGAAQQQVV